MNQEKIENYNVEPPLSLVELILQNPVYTFTTGIIIGLILSYIFRSLFANKNNLLNLDLQKKPIETESNFRSLFQNLGDSDKCKYLYKFLMRKVHPDKFLGTEKHERALELSKELGKNRINYSKLKELEKVILREFK